MSKFILKIAGKKPSPAVWKRGMARSIFSQAFGSEAQARRGHPEYSRGMTYVELIVVLSIFSIVSSVVIFNYSYFQSKIDVRNLASDIALQITQAQKDAIAGKVDSQASASWKPSYGVQFDTSADNKRFVYFADRDSDGMLTGGVCSGECLSSVAITKSNYISSLSVAGSGTCPSSVTKVEVTYTRPDSVARITTSPPSTSCTISYAQITITSPRGPSSVINVFPSGRIKLN